MSRNGTSTKTRIETTQLDISGAPKRVEMAHPLKQGLKRRNA